MRVTHQMLTNNNIQTMADNLDKLFDLQQKAAGGKKYNKVSENPALASEVINIRTTQQTLQSYLNGAETANSWLEATDFALAQSSDLGLRAQTLLMKGLNGAMGVEERQGIGNELDGIIKQAVSLGNTEHLGRFIFGGTKTLKTTTMPEPFTLLDANPGLLGPPPPFTITNSIQYNGDINAIQREISPGEPITINADGTTAGFSNFITSLIRLRDAMLKGPVDPATNVEISKDPRIGKLYMDPASLPLPGWSTINSVKGTDEPQDELDKGTYTFTVLANPTPGDRTNVTWEIRDYPGNVVVANGVGDDLTGTNNVIDLKNGGQTIGVKLGFSVDGLAAATSFRFEYNPMGRLMTDLETTSEGVIDVRATIGARLRNVDASIKRMEDSNLELKGLLSQKEDINIAEAASMMRNQETVYQAVISVSARMNNVMNLFDYLR